MSLQGSEIQYWVGYRQNIKKGVIFMSHFYYLNMPVSFIGSRRLYYSNMFIS